jgi:hypothetical protein
MYDMQAVDAMIEDFLKQSGVKGMKWGRRKARSGSSSSASDRKKTVDQVSTKSVKSLSNKQLKAANERLQLEKNYSKLKYDTTTRNQGKKIVAGILAAGATATTVYNLANSPAAKAGSAVVKNLLEGAIKDGSGQHALRVVATGARHLA